MQIWVALFRGINVGGSSVIRMVDLRQSLESLGLQNVQTYIQSGNVVFESPERRTASLRQMIAERISRDHNMAPQLLLLKKSDLLKAIRDNPFSDAEAEAKCLYFYFLAKRPTKAAMQTMAELQTLTDSFHLQRRVFYLHTPHGFAQSKLARVAENLLGVPATARNFRTVCKLREIVEGR